VREGLEEEFEEDLELKEGTTASDLLEQKGIEKEEVLVARNGTIISSSHELESGDTVEVFDVIAGG
jgi:thiamine biosynthesis protein ThiS